MFSILESVAAVSVSVCVCLPACLYVCFFLVVSILGNNSEGVNFLVFSLPAAFFLPPFLTVFASIHWRFSHSKRVKLLIAGISSHKGTSRKKPKKKRWKDFAFQRNNRIQPSLFWQQSLCSSKIENEMMMMISLRMFNGLHIVHKKD